MVGEVAAARTALQPVGTVVSALLGPKIERIKQWAIEKDLAKHLEEKKLSVLLENYLTRITAKISFVSTIVFPQEKIELAVIYEPITLSERSAEWGRSGAGALAQLDIAADGASYLIVDEAGMGKSTYVKSLCLHVLKDSDRIPVLYDLSEYDGSRSLFECIADMFDELDSVFSRELLKKLIVGGYLFIVLDGFDEVSSGARDKLAKEIKALNEKKRKTPLVVTSRPRESLPSIGGAVIYRLNRLNRKQVLSILERYDKYSLRTIGVDLINEIDKVPPRFLETPLLVGLLYRTYGFNGAIADKITIFYSEVFEALFKGHDLTKAGYVRDKESRLDIDDFRKLLTVFSYYYIVRSSGSEGTREALIELVNEAKALSASPDVSSKAFIDDLLLAVPLLTTVGSGIKFMHRSLAEYFAAEFISTRPQLLDRLISSKLVEQFRDSIEYIYELFPQLYLEKITVPLAQKYLTYVSLRGSGDVLWDNLDFISEWAISCWPLEAVSHVVGDRHMVTIPDSVGFTGTHYSYTSINDVDYVVCLGQKITEDYLARNAFSELGAEALSKSRTAEREAAKYLASILPLGQWHHPQDEIISNLKSNPQVEGVLRRGLMTTGVMICEDKCKAAIEALARLKQAEKNLDSILDF
ncbi:NACHT domain-containing protein [Ectopseudomonas mendocina]|uniref:NACHT domain-containing protein n=1 Tax=Ectopseudomonas mendocina TaxID=300 RepID=UPI000F83BD5A|nr:NACHT domain-containing protein [Pseudomonas mendocina]